MSTVQSGKIVSDGLVLCLDAANPKSYVSGSTTWFDLSGKNNHGTINNGVTFDSASNGCLSFNGIDGYVNIDSTVSLGAQQPTVIVVCTVANPTGTILAKGGYGSYWNYGITKLYSTVDRKSTRLNSSH